MLEVTIVHNNKAMKATHMPHKQETVTQTMVDECNRIQLKE